jgi:hypothetical protein
MAPAFRPHIPSTTDENLCSRRGDLNTAAESEAAVSQLKGRDVDSEVNVILRLLRFPHTYDVASGK